MNMSSIRLDPLIDEFPEQRAPVERLARFIDEKERADDRPKEFTVERMFDIAGPIPQPVLLEILQRLVQLGVLEKILRVSPDGMGGVGDYHSLAEVPPVVHDRLTGQEVQVSLDHIRLIYKLQARGIGDR
jgi:hypothetical protein